VNAVAEGGEIAALAEKIKTLEGHQETLEYRLQELKPIPQIPRAKIKSHLDEWRTLLRGSVTRARAVIQKAINGRILMIPLENGEGYQFWAETRFDKLFQGMAIPMPRFMQSLEPSTRGCEHLTPEETGDSEKDALLKRALSLVSLTTPSWNQLRKWLSEMASIRSSSIRSQAFTLLPHEAPHQHR